MADHLVAVVFLRKLGVGEGSRMGHPRPCSKCRVDSFRYFSLRDYGHPQLFALRCCWSNGMPSLFWILADILNGVTQLNLEGNGLAHQHPHKDLHLCIHKAPTTDLLSHFVEKKEL